MTRLALMIRRDILAADYRRAMLTGRRLEAKRLAAEMRAIVALILGVRG